MKFDCFFLMSHVVKEFYVSLLPAYRIWRSRSEYLIGRTAIFSVRAKLAAAEKAAAAGESAE